MFNVWTSMLFISKYTTYIQRWARKLLSRSARAKWLPPAPSEVEVAQLCSILLQKITAKVGPVYCLNLVQLSKGIPSFLVALVLPGTHLQGLQREPWLCTVLCHVPVAMPQEVPRAAHPGRCSHGHCSHHARRAAGLNTPTSCSQNSTTVSSLAPHFFTQFPVKLHKDGLPPTATLWNYCRIQFFSLLRSTEGCQLPVVRRRLWRCQKRHEVSTLSQAEQELWAFK